MFSAIDINSNDKKKKKPSVFVPGSSQTNDATSGPPQCKLCHLKLAVGSVTTQTGSDERGTSSLKYPLLASGW